MKSLTIAALAALLVAGPALAQVAMESRELSDARALIGDPQSSEPMARAINVSVVISKSPTRMDVALAFETAVGGASALATLSASGSPADRGVSILPGTLTIGSVPYPATLRIGEPTCDDVQCWETIEAEASNYSGETITVVATSH